MRLFTITLLLIAASPLSGQTFTKITTGPIATETPTGGYAGASWIDYNGDGNLDLFVNKDFLYENNGDGSFSKITNSGITGTSSGLNNGNSWGDADNDGDLDLLLVNQNSNGIFSNQGNGTFVKIDTGEVATNLNGWSGAWADYDNDGWLDFVVTHPCGFIGSCKQNWLFKNKGDGSFTEITDTDVHKGLAAFTVANWADFDDDGDMDLFIGSGEVNFASKDHIYVNQLMETGVADLKLTQTGVLFGDTRDGQNWNLIDYDNDGDLDAFVTNFKSDIPNDFYKNNGDGTFTKLTDADLGVHLVSEASVWLANTWGDFNNDGWLDVFITADFGGDFGNHFYKNNGDGTFAHHFPVMANLKGSRAVINGDYDNDGDLDLFINATQSGLRGLFRNELNPGVNENWINLTLEGTMSNRSAIGAKIRAKATIDGHSFWQRRDISSQNAFCGQNSLRVHFGLGDAAIIDSLVLEWPLGLKEIYTEVQANQFMTIIEGQATGLAELEAARFRLQVSPNPVDDETIISYQVGRPVFDLKISLLDNTQRLVSNIFEGTRHHGLQEHRLNTASLSSGVYYLILESEFTRLSKRILIIK